VPLPRDYKALEPLSLRCNEDGSYDVVPLGHEDDFMSTWQGVTLPELSIDDEKLFAPVFEKSRGKRKGMGRDEARATFTSLGIDVDDEKMKSFWAQKCKELRPGDDPKSVLLDCAQAYRLFVTSGFAAKQLATKALPGNELFKLYWNQVRMGGRDPENVDRAITLDDTLVILGLAKAKNDTKTTKAIESFEKKNGLKLPSTLEALWSKKGAAESILDSQCNNPEPIEPKRWKLERGTKKSAWGARNALRIMDPHQGDHGWWAVFGDGASDAEVWVSFEQGKPAGPRGGEEPRVLLLGSRRDGPMLGACGSRG